MQDARNPVVALFFYLGIFLTSSCGGGSNGAPFSVVSISPEDEGMHIAVDAPIVVKFNRIIDEKSLSSATFNVTALDSREKLRGKITFDKNTLSATFDPIDELNYDNDYEVRVSHKITDTNGSHLNESKNWIFTTTGEPPATLMFEPENNAQDVSVKTVIHAQFSSDIQPFSVTAETFYVHDANGSRVNGQLSTEANDIIFTPSVELQLATLYTVTIKSIKDIHNNEIGLSWTFTTSSTRTSTTLIGGPEEDSVSGFVSDNAGNVYIVGNSNSVIDNQRPTTSTSSSPGQPERWTHPDVMVAKYNGQGVREWIKLFGTDQFDTGNAITFETDASGNPTGLLVGGSTDGNIDNNVSGSDPDIFVASLDLTGNVRWKKQFSIPSHQLLNALLRNSNGDIIIVAASESNTKPAAQPPIPMPMELPSHKILIIKLDANGNEIKRIEQDSDADEVAHAAVLDSNGTLYLAGLRYDMNALKRPPDTVSISPISSNGDAFVFRYDTVNFVRTTTLIATDEMDSANDIAVDSSGNFYVAGVSRGSLNGSPSQVNNDAPFVAKYDQNGNRMWLKQWTDTESGEATNIAIAPNGRVYAAISNFNFFGAPPPFFPLPFKTRGRAPGDPMQGPIFRIFIYELDPANGTPSPTPRKINAREHATANDMSISATGTLTIGGYTHGAIDGAITLGWQDGFITQMQLN